MSRSKLRILTIGLIIIGIVSVGFFGLRTIRAIREFQKHPPPAPFATEQSTTDVSLIRDWMTVPFISKMYHVQQHILFDALEIPERGNKDKSLKQLNDEYYAQAEGIVLEKVKAAILANQIHVGPNTPLVP
jgi:hypothetical protein